MTPEERFERIEQTLDRLTERMDKADIDREVDRHESNLRLKKLEEMQVVLMESQNSTWAYLNQLTANIEKWMQRPGSNGHGE